MRETDLRAVPVLNSLPIFNEDDAAVRGLIDHSPAEEIAEAADTVRLFDLLHRDEYEAVAGILDDQRAEQGSTFMKAAERYCEKRSGNQSP